MSAVTEIGGLCADVCNNSRCTGHNREQGKSNARNALLGGRAKSHGREAEEEEITKKPGMG